MQDNMPTMPEFRPSEEEFKNPLEYIQSIAATGVQYGACKIIPPPSFRPTYALGRETFPTRLVIARPCVSVYGAANAASRRFYGATDTDCILQQTILNRISDFESGGVAFNVTHRKNHRTYTLDE